MPEWAGFLDGQLDELSSVVADLKQIGREMNAELRDQSAKIDRLAESADRANAGIEKSTRHVAGLV